jgi:type II secretory pathway component PulF
MSIEKEMRQAVRDGEAIEKAMEQKEFFRKAWIRRH